MTDRLEDKITVATGAGCMSDSRPGVCLASDGAKGSLGIERVIGGDVAPRVK